MKLNSKVGGSVVAKVLSIVLNSVYKNFFRNCAKNGDEWVGMNDEDVEKCFTNGVKIDKVVEEEGTDTDEV